MHDGALQITGHDVSRSVAATDVEVGEASRGAPRTLRLRDGGSCDVHEGPALDALLARLGHRDSAVVRWQSMLAVAIAAAVALLLGALFAYTHGVPWLSEQIALHLPSALNERIGEQTLALFDRTSFEPSALPIERQEQLRARFDALETPGPAVAHRLHFRAAPGIGANAFAIPGGDIVVTDGLVELAEHDEELLGVLAHELGHVRDRHALRSFLQNSAVAVAAAVYFGDVSAVGTGTATFLIQARYSRDFEREADGYAVAMLRANGVAPAHFATILTRLEANALKFPAESLLPYLSSHPVTAERIATIEAGGATP